MVVYKLGTSQVISQPSRPSAPSAPSDRGPGYYVDVLTGRGISSMTDPGSQYAKVSRAEAERTAKEPTPMPVSQAELRQQSLQSQMSAAPQPKTYLEKAEKWLREQKFRLSQRKGDEPLTPVVLTGLGAAAGVLKLAESVRHPVQTSKSLGEYGYYVARQPRKAYFEAGAELGSTIREYGPGYVIGEAAALYGAGKGIGAVTSKVTELGGKTLYPKYVPTRPSPKVIQTTPRGIIRPVSAEQRLYHVSKSVIGITKVDPEIARKGFGRERAAFARASGEPEEFLYFSKEQPYIQFGWQSLKKGRTLTYEEYPKGRYQILYLNENILGYSPELIRRIEAGEYGPELRAALVREVKARKGQVLPGTRTAAGMGFEEEYVLAPYTQTPQRSEFFPEITYDPYLRKFVRIKKASLDIEGPEPKSLLSYYEEMPVRERVKSAFVKPKALTPEEELLMRRGRIYVRPVRKVITPSFRAPSIPTARAREIIPETPRGITTIPAPRTPKITTTTTGPPIYPGPPRPDITEGRIPNIPFPRTPKIPPTQPPIRPPVKPPSQPPPKPPRTPSTSLFKTAKKIMSTKGYELYIKRRGKYKKVAGLFPKGEAIKKGTILTKETLSARFKVIGTQKYISKPDISYEPGREFRPYRIVKGRKVALMDEWIQKAQYRLGTRPEVREIQAARKQSFFKPSVKKSKKRKKSFWL